MMTMMMLMQMQMMMLLLLMLLMLMLMPRKIMKRIKNRLLKWILHLQH
jgi:ABC-type branched-subunit amino acid transport system permease subunit